MSDPNARRRAAHALVALCAATGLALHYAVVLGHSGEVVLRTVRFFSYFTILTNLLVLISATGAALGRGRLAALVDTVSWQTAATLHIIVVALIYHLLLRNVTLPGVTGWWANCFVHQIVPVIWTTCWLVFPPHGGIDRIAPLRWLLYPVAFTAWTLVHGALGGWYPYPFMDVGRFGYPQVLGNIAMIGLLFLALGEGLRRIDSALSRFAATA